MSYGGELSVHVDGRNLQPRCLIKTLLVPTRSTEEEWVFLILFVTAISTAKISDWMFHLDSGEAGPFGAFSMASQAVGIVVLSIRAVALQHDVIAL